MNQENFLEDLFGTEYELADMGSDFFGISKVEILLISVLKELKELNRVLYNNLEARR